MNRRGNNGRKNEKISFSTSNNISYKKTISLKEITNLYAKEADQIILELLNPKFGFDLYLNAPTMGSNLINQLVLLIEKTLECSSMQIMLRQLLKKISESKFFKEFVFDLINKLENNIYNIDLIKSVLKICCKMVTDCSNIVESFSSIRDRLELLIKYRLNQPDLVNEFDNKFVPSYDATLAKAEYERNRKTFKNVDHSHQEPPSDFTNMNIIPKLEDIMIDYEPFLRKNVTNGAYNDVNHYLDVQFRLLREDYLSPLREGISSFRSIIREDKFINNKNAELTKDIKRKLKNIESLNVYFNVTLESTILTDEGSVYAMKLDMDEKLNAANWENSKKLMFGSLICLSSDLFLNKCLIGVISQRELKHLKKGLIFIRFNFDLINSIKKENLPSLNVSYTMIETTAYFESYKHVLEAFVSFKTSNHDEFPFKEHLIFCQNKFIDKPKYLKNACIDIRTLVDNNKTIQIDRKGGANYMFSKSCEKFSKCFIENPNDWPTSEEMKLDNSQYEAVKLALQNRLALIQGPPGTGKTFIGVKIVQLLMNNKHLWWDKNRFSRKPILMICYTNHALDQFLEYCINECGINSGVIRVGGRSKSEALNSFLLSNVKNAMRGKREIDINIYIQIRDQKIVLKSIEYELNELNNLIECVSLNGLLTFDALKNYMADNQIRQFEEQNFLIESRMGRTNQDFSLLEWLGILNIDNLNEIDLIEQNLNNIDLNNNLAENENENNQTDFFDQENQERMLEDDDYISATISAYIKSRDEKLKKQPQFFDVLIDQEDIFEMIVDFNSLYNPNKLEIFLKNSKFDSGFTKVESKRSKQRAKKQENFNEFISNYLNSIVKNELNEYPNENVSIFELNYNERFSFYKKWLNEFKQTKLEEAEKLNNKFNLNANLLKELRLQEDLYIMKNAYIIAMTTSGSSRYHKVLKDIGPRIIIVEEAAEVFEAHVVSSLSEKCEHLILIGDHVQLRPNPAVFKLATTYKLDVSLFERLVKNDTKRVMLNCQHRMRPEISVLMKHFYDEPIQDHSSVNSFENLIGFHKNVHFLNHTNLENNLNDSQSKMNKFEADYLAQVCLYLKKQSYDLSQITILTMYLGQLMETRKSLNKLGLNGVKVSTVDNYQGEENDFILLSLVRSNCEEKIGFLKIDNRVCVALSRARKGLFCIGNLEMIANKSETWSKVVNTVKNMNYFSDSILLTCGAHPQNDIEASLPEHFELRPDGGCKLKCNFRLKCGHVCALFCHSYDKSHEKYQCKKNCNKLMKCGHYCAQMCGHLNECDKCDIGLDKIITECSHPIKFRCDTVPLKTDCIFPCEKILNCGHLCTKKCSNRQCDPCITKIEIISTCKHETKLVISCCDQEKIWDYQNKCHLKCNEILKCGHSCQSKCSDCFGGLVHANCKDNCDRLLYCSHKCTIPCSRACVPCLKDCMNKCVHSMCMEKCSKPCSTCLENCALKCKHKQCSKKCYELCDIEPCNEPCDKTLNCGHSCLGLCGDPCPRLCRICHSEKVSEIFFGTEEEPDARFVLLKDCGHMLEVTGMNGWIKSRYEEIEENTKNNSIQFPECPKCKTQIRNTLRYSNIIKKQLMLIEEIKLKQYGDPKQNKIDQTQLLNEIVVFKKKNLHLTNNYSVKFIKEMMFDLENNEFSFNKNVSFRNAWNIFCKLNEIKSKLDIPKENTFQINFINFEIKKISNLIFDKYKIQIMVENGKQRIEEIYFEIERITMLIDLFRFKNINFTENQDKIARIVDDLEICLYKKIYCFDKVRDRVEDNFKQLKKLTNFELTKAEKAMIVSAMGLSPGHWYKCPNNHIYCIDACGGAMQESKCPECKSSIGGSNHRLLDGNKVATEMDGATQAAWPL